MGPRVGSLRKGRKKGPGVLSQQTTLARLRSPVSRAPRICALFDWPENKVFNTLLDLEIVQGVGGKKAL